MITDKFIREVDWAIGDVIDKHADDLFPDGLKGGQDMWTVATEGAVLAINKYIKEWEKKNVSNRKI